MLLDIHMANCCVVHQDDSFKPQDQTEKTVKFEQSHDVDTLDAEIIPKSNHKEKDEICILIVEDFLLYTSRNYTEPDSAGRFDGHVWTM
uniref:Uncharacterized protein n=1 Tax=Amphiprion ocellaris TaxID=80972 RepID=A0AAQ5Z2D4_AMPOC